MKKILRKSQKFNHQTYWYESSANTFTAHFLQRLSVQLANRSSSSRDSVSIRSARQCWAAMLRCYFFIICKQRRRRKKPESKHRDAHKETLQNTVFWSSPSHRGPGSGYGCKKGEIERNKQRRKGSSRRLVREKRAPDNKESLSFSFREKWSPKGASGEVIKSKIC